MTAGGGYSIVKCEEVPDPTGDYPGEMRMFTGALRSEQVALTYRRMPPQTGGMKGLRWGHSHKTQEEIYFVLSGTLHVKIGDEDVELVMCSVKVEDLRAEAQIHQDFWQG